ncbi:MAG: antA/AntB antirepressor family protein, partial [Enterocloster asparagiformis]|nr:antA/AntB antirepressor family protein [Enterocloster asparagiformis]
MNEIMTQSFTDTSHLTPIEIALGVDENGMTTAKRLYEFLELNTAVYARWFRSNILENEFAEEGIDYFPFNTNVECGGQASKDARLTAHFAKKLSVKGNGEKAEQAREYFAQLEERVKEAAIDRSQLNPGTQLMLQLAENISRQELEQKRQAREQERQGAELEQVKENQKVIAQALAKPVEKSFREWVNESLSAIAESEGYLYIGSSQERHRAVRTESYERLNCKRPCRLDQRVSRARGEAATAGATKNQVNAINKLSIIEADRDLKPVYEAVIREMLAA